MSKVILRDVIAQHWNKDNALEKVRATTGFVAKAKDNRRVVRFDLGGEILYLKHHVGVGWKEIFKNLFQLKIPVLGAINEWNAIEHLSQLKIHTMKAIAFGEYGCNPAKKESFLITEELSNTITLEKLCSNWSNVPPSYALRKALVEQVALIASEMHRNGLNHRDFYLCHILLDISDGLENLDTENLILYLVDLHRMQIREKIPERWRIKDIGSIYFSALNSGLNRRDVVRFMRCYQQEKISNIVSDSFWQAVKKRTLALCHSGFKQNPELPL